MNYLTPSGIFLALSLSVFAEPDTTKRGPDLLRFSEKANHDTLHGKFIAFGKAGTLVFKSTEAIEPTTFSTAKLHRATLGKGRAQQPLSATSAVTAFRAMRFGKYD